MFVMIYDKSKVDTWQSNDDRKKLASEWSVKHSYLKRGGKLISLPEFTGEND